jgi:hypothetical protein
MQAANLPVFGVSYTYDAVAKFYKHDETLVSFVIVKGPRILALRLREDFNPNILQIPAEVWVGDRPPAVSDWGKTLAHTKEPVPVFVKRHDKVNYTFVGYHDVLPRIPNAAQLAYARAEVPHTQGVSRIVFLKRVAEA